jgi:hypothetical protein
MIAQDFDFPEDFLKERRIGDYGRLRKILWKIKRPARARQIYETSGLDHNQTKAAIRSIVRKAARAY